MMTFLEEELDQGGKNFAYYVCSQMFMLFFLWGLLTYKKQETNNNKYL